MTPQEAAECSSWAEYHAKLLEHAKYFLGPKAEATYASSACRCREARKIEDCTSGCALLTCCGGYLIEGHSSDCPDPMQTAVTWGERCDPMFTGQSKFA